MNIEELKKIVIGKGFQESHGSTTMVIDVETVIDLIDEYKAINYTHCCTELKPKQECYKSGEPCKYDCSGLCRESC